jgi:hypothetical protein|uniref:Regulatory protein zeste n=1 Tax=Panagrolaimus sp. PS1159 TaxID=55785 RepID=A0AC35FER2_9BILA
MGRGSTTRSSFPSTPQPQSSSSAVTFDDEENFITSVLISLHEEIIGNTASSGPAVDAKNKVWNLISNRLCNKIGGVYRNEEQVKTRWRSMRSAYSFKVEKPRHIAELFYKKLQGTTHGVRVSDITVTGMKFPQWLNNLIKTDALLKAKSQESPPPKQAFLSSRRSILKRTSPAQEEEKKDVDTTTDAPPERKRSRPTRACTTVPKLISQFPPSELSSVRRSRTVKREDEKSTTPDSFSPTSVTQAEELNSVTESGTNSPIETGIFWEETDYEVRRRREEELHQAKLGLLRAQTQESDAKRQLTMLQIKSLMRRQSSLSLRLPSSADTVNNEIEVEIPPNESSVETPPNLEINNQTAEV